MSENGKKPVGEVVVERLREYARAYRKFFQVSAQVPPDHPDRKTARYRLDELEAGLVGDIVANAPNGALERAVFEALGTVERLNGLMEKVTDALAVAQNAAAGADDRPFDGHLGTVTPALAAKLVNVAENQPEYLAVRVALVTQPDFPSPRGFNTVVMAFRPTEAQRWAIAAGEDLYVSLLTFGQPQQPIMVMVGKGTAAATFGVRATEEAHADLP